MGPGPRLYVILSLIKGGGVAVGVIHGGDAKPLQFTFSDSVVYPLKFNNIVEQLSQRAVIEQRQGSFVGLVIS